MEYLYNVKYKTEKDGEWIYPSRYGIKFKKDEVQKNDFITYKDLVLLVTEVKGYSLECIQIKTKAGTD